MKHLTLFFVFFFSLTIYANAQFISHKGELHILAGAAISATTYTIVYANTKNKKKAFWYGIAASTLVGVGKEVYDSTHDIAKFDNGDAAATTIGGIMASVTLSLFVGKNSGKRKKTLVVVH
ncbi:hypothetical protein [Mariniflexile sp.]|uniref:hypothetical protein n=1 Tax=Mariniflexile sp. TaxID=1979402 RepID=UPI003569CA18